MKILCPRTMKRHLNKQPIFNIIFTSIGFFFLVLALGAVFVALHPTITRVAGVVVASGIVATGLLVGRVSPRAAGFTSLIAAGITAVVAELGNESWPMKPHEI